MSRIILTNANIVTPENHFEGSVVVEDGYITDILKGKSFTEGFDLDGLTLAPGCIDIHSDYLEKEIRPRPSAKFPTDLAFYFMDQRAAACGITNVHSAISFNESSDKARTFEQAINQSLEIDELRKTGLVKHNVHARLTPNLEAVLPYLDKIKAIESLKLVVYNEDIPGARQFTMDQHVDMRLKHYAGSTREEIKKMLEEKAAEMSQFNLRPEIQAALGNDFVLGSHDDTTEFHVEEAKQFGCNLSEMPTTIEAARKSKELGLFVCMGAPNYVRGGSHCGNLGCHEAMEEDLVDMICSDYHFPSLLISVVKMVNSGMDISKAFNMVSLNPAMMLGMDHEIGSIEVGKQADLIAIETKSNFAKVKHVWVDGKWKFSSDAQGIPQMESINQTEIINN